MDEKEISKMTMAAQEHAKWVGLEERDLAGEVCQIIINAAHAGLSHCTVGCLSNKQLIADMKKCGFIMIENGSGGEWTIGWGFYKNYHPIG